jgi:hypothetical protein
LVSDVLDQFGHVFVVVLGADLVGGHGDVVEVRSE